MSIWVPKCQVHTCLVEPGPLDKLLQIISRAGGFSFTKNNFLFLLLACIGHLGNLLCGEKKETTKNHFMSIMLRESKRKHVGYNLEGFARE